MFSSPDRPVRPRPAMPRRPMILGLLLAMLAACSEAPGTAAPKDPVEAATPAAPDPARVGHYGLGREATAAEIAGWDIDVNPQGEGLPPGSGSVEDGEFLYDELCAECHGTFGEGANRYPMLAGGQDSLTDPRPVKTVGSYWKYTSTLWDYIHRAMPFLQPESLTDDQVYALTAYVLYLNDLVGDDFVLTRENLTSIRLPNEGNFVADPRPDTANTRCMRDCRAPGSVRVAAVAPRTDDSGNPLSDGEAEAAAVSAPAPEPANLSLGVSVYAGYCAVCHASGMGGAPLLGDVAEWQRRLMDGGEDALIRRALEGFTGDAGVMPARGGSPQLDDEQVAAAVRYMMEAVQ